MNKLIKLLTLGTVLPLSLNSLNLVSVSYSSDNSLSTGVEDFTWAQEAFKLPKQCFERISYLVNGNIRAKTESISDKNSQDEYWANRAINDKTAAYFESIKNLKIIYTVVREGGKQGLEILRGGILKTIENILNNSLEDEETYKKLMGSLNALLITETVNEMYHGSDKDDSFENLYDFASNNMGNEIIKLLANNSDKYKKLLQIIDDNCEQKELEQSKQYDDKELIRIILLKSMKHDWNCYLRQIGIIDDIVGENDVKKSVLFEERRLTGFENKLIKLNNNLATKCRQGERVRNVADIVEKLNQDEKFNKDYKKINGIAKEIIFGKAKFNGGSEKLFDRSSYNGKYLLYILYRDYWLKQRIADGKYVNGFDFVCSKIKKILPNVWDSLKGVALYDKQPGALVRDIFAYLHAGVVQPNILFSEKSALEKETWITAYLTYFAKFMNMNLSAKQSQPLLNVSEYDLAYEINRMIFFNVNADVWISTMHDYIKCYSRACNFFTEDKARQFLFRVTSLKCRLKNVHSMGFNNHKKDRMNKFVEWFLHNVYQSVNDLYLYPCQIEGIFFDYENKLVKMYENADNMSDNELNEQLNRLETEILEEIKNK